MGGGVSQAQDHKQASQAKIRYSVSSIFAIGCSLEVLAQMINCELCSFSFQVTWEIVKAYNVGPVVKKANPRPQSTLSGSFYQDQNIWRLN